MPQSGGDLLHHQGEKPEHISCQEMKMVVSDGRFGETLTLSRRSEVKHDSTEESLYSFIRTRLQLLGKMSSCSSFRSLHGLSDKKMSQTNSAIMFLSAFWAFSTWRENNCPLLFINAISLIVMSSLSGPETLWFLPEGVKSR